LRIGTSPKLLEGVQFQRVRRFGKLFDKSTSGKRNKSIIFESEMMRTKGIFFSGIVAVSLGLMGADPVDAQCAIIPQKRVSPIIP
jgi:hypothetical protein